MQTSDYLMCFVSFDPVDFLTQSKLWKERIKELEHSLDSISELPAVESSGVQTSGTSDLTARLASKRMSIDSEIYKLRMLLNVRDNAIAKLSDDEKELIKGFFFGKKKIEVFVDDYGTKHLMCRSDVYSARKEALNHFSEIITSKYGL